MMPFEWVVGDSSKDHTVAALTSRDEPATGRYTTLRGTTDKTEYSSSLQTDRHADLA